MGLGLGGHDFKSGNILLWLKIEGLKLIETVETNDSLRGKTHGKSSQINCQRVLIVHGFEGLNMIYYE